MNTLENPENPLAPETTLWPRLRRKLLAPETRLLLFWPIFELIFMALERLRPADTQYFATHCALDDLIPFWEGAMVPYLFWFLYLGGTVAYTYFRDVPAFRRMMRFLILTYGVTVLIYLVFPNCQNLRPAVFPRDNVLTRFTAWFYTFDTNTDVCPSLHVVGSLAAYFGLRDCRRFRSRGWQLGSALAAAAICLSTLFLKQHSAVDVLAALPLCAVAYVLIYRRKTP